jgi:hypothetical protein
LPVTGNALPDVPSASFDVDLRLGFAATLLPAVAPLLALAPLLAFAPLLALAPLLLPAFWLALAALLVLVSPLAAAFLRAPANVESSPVGFAAPLGDANADCDDGTSALPEGERTKGEVSMANAAANSVPKTRTGS